MTAFGEVMIAPEQSFYGENFPVWKPVLYKGNLLRADFNKSTEHRQD